MLHEALDPECVGATSSVVFGPEQTIEDEPIEVKFKEMGIPCTPQKIVQVRDTVEKMLHEERLVKVRRKYVTEAEFEDVLRKLPA